MGRSADKMTGGKLVGQAIGPQNDQVVTSNNRLGLPRGELWLIASIAIAIAIAIAVFGTIALATDAGNDSPAIPVSQPFPILSDVGVDALEPLPTDNFAPGGLHVTD